MEVGRYRPARAHADHLPVTARQANRPRVTTASDGGNAEHFVEAGGL